MTRGRGRWWLILLVAPVVYAVGIAVVGVEDAREALARASAWWLFAALALQAVVTLTWPLVHRASVRAVGHDLRYRQALNVSMSAFTVSHTVPGGGAVAAGVVVERLTAFGLPGPAATASASLTGPAALVTVVGLATGGVAVAVVAGELPPGALVLAVAGLLSLAAVLGLVMAALRSPRLGERVIAALARRHERLEERAEGWRRSWRTVTEHGPGPVGVGRILAWASAKWAADLASLALVFVAFGQTPRITVLLIGFGVAQGLAAVPISPGGLGLVEGGMVGVFVTLGLPAGVATPIVLVYRLLESWLPTAAGVPVVVGTMGRRG